MLIMLIAPHGILPDELIHPDRLRDVIIRLLAAPYAGWQKAQILRGWSITTGVRPSAEDYARVESAHVEGTWKRP